MTQFDPERFEDKYKHYFPELQQAYKNAFNRMNDQYDSDLVHAIDQQVLNESEPFYDETAGFHVELPEDPYDRLSGVVVEEDRFQEILSIHVEAIETELERILDP